MSKFSAEPVRWLSRTTERAVYSRLSDRVSLLASASGVVLPAFRLFQPTPMLQLVRALVGLEPVVNGRSAEGFFLSADRFELAATAERMRVDRNGSLVSLLAIEPSETKSSSRDLKELERRMASRLRLTDTAGWMRDGRVGVLLPDTPEAGAWVVAADLCEPYRVGSDRPACEVIVYPSQHGGGEGGSEAPSPKGYHRRRADEPRSSQPVAADHDASLATASRSRIEAGPANARVARRGPHMKSNSTTYDHVIAKPLPAWKRLIDIAGATLGLLVASPVIAAAAAAVRLTSPGPAFFVQEREGLGGKRFKMYKIRSMRNDAESLKSSLLDSSEQDGPAFKMAADPRITPIGRLIRKTSIDELPQLWNVLKGEMSLVGPRPLPVSESLACEPWQRRRLLITPGITCTWQIYGRNVVPFDDWIRMDLDYAERRTPWLDLSLVAKTGATLVKSKGQ